MGFFGPGSHGGGMFQAGEEGEPFDLSQAPGAIVWYRADDSNNTLATGYSKLSNGLGDTALDAVQANTAKQMLQSTLGDGAVTIVGGTGQNAEVASQNILNNVAGATLYTLIQYPSAPGAAQNVYFVGGSGGTKFNLQVNTNNTLSIRTLRTSGEVTQNFQSDLTYGVVTPGTWVLQASTVDFANRKYHSFFNGQYAGHSYGALGVAGNTGTTGGLMAVGASSAQGSPFVGGYIREVFMCNVEHTREEMDQVVANIKSRWPGLSGVLSTTNYSFACIGDSLTFGTGIQPNYNTQSYPYQLAALYTDSWAVNFGKSGDTLAQITTRLTNTGQLPNGFNSFNKLAGTRIAIFWGGTNDIVSGRTNAQILTDINTAVTSIAGSGNFDQIYVLTLIPYGANSTTGQARLDASAHLVANEASILTAGATDLIDLTQDSAFNANTSQNDTTYYNADKVHLTQTGYGRVASIVKTAIDANQ